LATLAVTSAFAQSTVTISGTFDANVKSASTTYAGTGNKVTQNSLGYSDQGTSGVIFKGNEDLGGGLKANFWYELNFNPTRGSTNLKAPNDTPAAGASATNQNSSLNNGEVYVGVSGGFGDFKIGSPNTPSLTAQTGRHPFGTKVGGGFNGVTGLGHVRQDKAISYATPSFSGFTAVLNIAAKVTPDANGATAVTQSAGSSDLGLNYNKGPLNLGLSNFSTSKLAADTSNNKQTNVYANYTIAAATIYVGAHNETATTGAKSSSSNIALKYMVTPTVALLANTGKLDDKSTANKDKRISALGVKYELSKRSSVYARYVSEKNDNATANTGVSNVKTTLVGLNHNF
jgi:predicted porin